MAVPDLESRFLRPLGWRFDTFTNRAGKTLRYGHMVPDYAKAIVVGLQGLSEFAEKYYETAHDMLARGYGFVMMDWRGQGGSDRFLPNHHKRHAVSFDADLADLDEFLTRIVLPMAAGRKLILLGHSMGGNIALRYLERRTGVFSAAALSAPMAGISAVKAMTPWLALALSGGLNLLFGNRYIWGGGDWHPTGRSDPKQNIFSHDPARNAVHDAWCIAEPQLQVGSITYHWLYQAIVSCMRINTPGVPERIGTPCLIALADDDHLVYNDAARRLAARIPGAQVLELPGAYHEILMETDETRGQFLAAFDALVASAI